MRRRNPTPLPLWPQRKMASQNQGDGRQVGEAEGWGGLHHLSHRYTQPPRPSFNLGRLHPPSHTPKLLSATIKGEHVICLCYSSCMNKIPPVFAFPSFPLLPKATSFALFLLHMIV